MTPNNPFGQFQLVIVKASFETNEPDPNKRMRFRMSSSDVGKDLSDEAMSLELFKSFVERIKTNAPIPEAFKSVICEDDWCGGMPYLSVAHYRAGKESRNVPGIIEDVFVDGDVLKSKGYCQDTPMGRAVFNSLLDDQHKRKSGVSDFDPVRVSIGFLDLKHKHQLQDGGGEFIFERKTLTDSCPLCEKSIGGKIYVDGVLVHEAMTRVPMNPRTLMIAEDVMAQKSDTDIKTKKDDARSVIGDLADTLDDALETKSILVTKNDVVEITQGSEDVPYLPELEACFNSNTGGYDQACIDAKVAGQMVADREGMAAVKSETVNKGLLDGVLSAVVKVYKSNGLEMPVEVIMDAQVVEKVSKKELEKADEQEQVKEDEKEVKKEVEKKEKSALEVAQTNLKSLVESGKATREEVQAAFNTVAAEVEKSYVAPAPDLSNLAEIVKSAVESAVAPLRIEIATLRAAKTAPAEQKGVPASRALKLTPEDLTKRSQSAPARQLTQIERIARQSTGAPVD